MEAVNYQHPSLTWTDTHIPISNPQPASQVHHSVVLADKTIELHAWLPAAVVLMLITDEPHLVTFLPVDRSEDPDTQEAAP